MTETHSKSRQTAEIAFSKTQTEFTARNRIKAEIQDESNAHNEKTLRLRNARLAKELEDSLTISPK